MKIKFIDHMRYRDFAEPGWYMWVYPDDSYEYLDWMEANMDNDFSAIPRFNSGNPMVETFITSDSDYAKFKLRWSSNISCTG